MLQPSFISPFDVVGPRHLPTMPITYNAYAKAALAATRMAILLMLLLLHDSFHLNVIALLK